MKARILIIFMVIFTVSLVRVNAQPLNDSVNLWSLYPGYVVTNDGDTIEGHLLLSNLVANQRKVFYFRDPDNPDSKIKYKPKDIKAYKVGPRHYESFKFAATNAIRKHNFFLKKIDGPICLYRWYYEPESRSSQRVKIDEDNILNSKIDLSFSEEDLTAQDVAIKQGGKPINLTAVKYLIKFKKHMAKIVDDYEELAEKIRNKEEGYTFGFHEDIIIEYNEWYKGKQ